MPLSSKYVIVNIWTSKENPAIPGSNVGHVSLTTPGNYMSLWPGEFQLIKPSKEKVTHRYFREREPEFQMSYEIDCLLESLGENKNYKLSLISSISKDTHIQPYHLYVGLMDDGSLQYQVLNPSKKKVSGIIKREILDALRSEHSELIPKHLLEQLRPCLFGILNITAERGDTREVLIRPIYNRDNLQEGEIVIRKDDVDKTSIIWRDAIPAYTESKYSFQAVKLIQANFRMALYTLETQEIDSEFLRLQKTVSGWRMVGSNLLTRNFLEETTENCASLGYRCLNAGGLSGHLKSKLSSKTSCVVSPDDLLRLIVAMKERELIDYPHTASWTIPEIIESPLEDVKRAYKIKGLNANAEDDIFPGIVPSGKNCSIM